LAKIAVALDDGWRGAPGTVMMRGRDHDEPKSRPVLAAMGSIR
jgi:hypothetical protein